MAKKLRELEVKHDVVLALVGDGHIPGMARILKDRELKLIRIQEVRDWQPKIDGGTSISYSFNA